MLLNPRVLFYYLWIGIVDSCRATAPLAVNATVFSGVCLLLLVVEGLKGGLVEKLRYDIAKSPTSTMGYWTTNDSSLTLGADAEKKLLQHLPAGSLIVPDISKIFKLECGTFKKNEVSVQATILDDPLLERLTVWRSNCSDGILLSKALAADLGVNTTFVDKDAIVTVTLLREDDSGTRSASVKLPVAGVIHSEQLEVSSAYINRTVLEQFVDFSQGEGVAGRPWPGNFDPSSIGWDGYLSFSKVRYGPEDLKQLRQFGYNASPVIEDWCLPNAITNRTLYGLLKHHDLFVNYVTPGALSGVDAERCRDDPGKIDRYTTNNEDIAVEWCCPEVAMIRGRVHVLVGHVPPRRWLYKQYANHSFATDRIAFFTILVPGSPPGRMPLIFSTGTELLVNVGDGSRMRADFAHRYVRFVDRIVCNPNMALFDAETRTAGDLPPWSVRDSWKSSKLRLGFLEMDQYIESGLFPLAYCSPELLGAIREYRRGNLSFNSDGQKFERLQRPNKWYAGRFHVRAIEDVPVAVSTLREKGYWVHNTSADRVLEMQQYVGTLDKLVLFLEVIGVALGFAISVALFFDLTHRRRGTLSMLRVIGFHWVGTMLFIFVRAAMVAIMGCLLAMVALLFILSYLYFFPVVVFTIPTSRIWLICCGSIICALFGVLPQAIVASKQDPTDGLRLGKVQ
jgi:hypothetical protein